MPQTLEPREALALLSGEMVVLDVRDPRDWASGHVPGARSLPLEELRADPKTALGDARRVLFVCARGMRSLTAAKLAEEAGVSEAFSLDGGIIAWASAGLPIETPPADAPAAKAAAAEVATVSDPSCGLPAPGLESVVGENLRALRTARTLTLDALAKVTGLSRTLLGQIELGKTAPSVGMVWKLARALDVHFSALLVNPHGQGTTVLRGKNAKRLVSPDGRFSSRALYPFENEPDAEFYELFLAPHSREDAQPHAPGTRENLIVTRGRLELQVAAERYELETGDAILFTADVAHSYVNPGKEECWMYLVMTYARRDGGTA